MYPHIMRTMLGLPANDLEWIVTKSSFLPQLKELSAIQVGAHKETPVDISMNILWRTENILFRAAGLLHALGMRKPGPLWSFRSAQEARITLAEWACFSNHEAEIILCCIELLTSSIAHRGLNVSGHKHEFYIRDFVKLYLYARTPLPSALLQEIEKVWR